MGSDPVAAQRALTPAFFWISDRFIHAWRGSTVSTKVDTYQSRTLCRVEPCSTEATATATAKACIAWDGGSVGQRPVDPRHAWMNLNRNRKNSIELEEHPRMAWIYCVDQGRHLPTAAGDCRRRGGSGCGGVSRMDAATELTWTYLQRPPQPDPPRHSPRTQRLTLTLNRQVQGAALQTTNYSASRCTWRQSSAASARTAWSASGRCSSPSS